MRLLRVAPVTAECLFVCSALFAACLAQSWEGQHFRDVQREWGANTTLQVFAIKGDRREAVDAELNGPFDLWDGQWWRIPISAFHHADIAHAEGISENAAKVNLSSVTELSPTALIINSSTSC